MQEDADEITFGSGIGKTKVHLSCIYKDTLAACQIYDLAVYIIFQFSGQDSDQFYIVVPMVGRRIIWISERRLLCI